MATKGLLRTCNPTFLHCPPLLQSLNAINKSLAKGWPHLENLHLQETRYIPRQAAHSLHRGPNPNIDHSSLQRPNQTCYNLSSLESCFQMDLPQGLCTCCSTYLNTLPSVFRWPGPSYLSSSNVSASERPSLSLFTPSYPVTFHHKGLCFFFF